MIIEWNTHMFSADTYRYPFHPWAAYVPGPERRSDDPLGEYRSRMKDEGIDRAILVHPEPYGDDHRLVIDCVAVEPDLFKTTALFYPDDPGAPAKLLRLVADHPGVFVVTVFMLTKASGRISSRFLTRTCGRCGALRASLDL